MYKKPVFIIVLFVSLFLFPGRISSQELSSLVVFVFEVSGTGLKPEDGEAITRRCIDEIRSWGTVTVLDESQAGNADYVVRGKLSRDRNGLTLSAVTLEGKTEKNLVSAKEQASTMEELNGKLFDFCIQIVQPVPFPNYLIGKWEASIPVGGSPLLCRLEFKSNRTVVVERYDTYEYQTGSVLKYEGYGNGSYTYIGRIRRVMAFRDSRGNVYRESPVDGSLSISLTLKDALPAYTPFSSSRLYLVFDEGRSGFELVSSGLPCGENNGGPSVYPQKNLAYTKFVKIE